jgi:hypothetical protein
MRKTCLYELLYPEDGICRPCPFLAKKKQAKDGNPSVDSDSQQRKGEFTKSSQPLQLTQALNEKHDSPPHSGIRISADGQYEVFVNGKSVENNQKGVSSKGNNPMVSRFLICRAS